MFGRVEVPMAGRAFDVIESADAGGLNRNRSLADWMP